MADWQCFCTTVNKPDARECWVCGLRRPDIPRAEAAPPAPAPARPRYLSPPPLPTAPAASVAPGGTRAARAIAAAVGTQHQWHARRRRGRTTTAAA